MSIIYLLSTYHAPNNATIKDSRFNHGQRLLKPLSFAFGRKIRLLDTKNLIGATCKTAPLALRIIVALTLILLFPVTLVLVAAGIPLLKNSNTYRQLTTFPELFLEYHAIDVVNDVDDKPPVVDNVGLAFVEQEPPPEQNIAQDTNAVNPAVVEQEPPPEQNNAQDANEVELAVVEQEVLHEQNIAQDANAVNPAVIEEDPQPLVAGGGIFKPLFNLDHLGPINPTNAHMVMDQFGHIQWSDPWMPQPGKLQGAWVLPEDEAQGNAEAIAVPNLPPAIQPPPEEKPGWKKAAAKIGNGIWNAILGAPNQGDGEAAPQQMPGAWP